MQELLWLPTRAMRGLIEATNDAIVITSAHNLNEPGPGITYANPAFLKIAGYRLDEVIGRSPRMLQGPGTDRSALKRIRQALTDGRACREEVLNYGRDGRPYWLDIHIVPLLGEDGSIQYFAAIERDVTAQRGRLDRLHRLAHEDSLTGIANRAALQKHMEVLMSGYRDNSGQLYFLMIDLDDFKAVNDTLGHQAGDNTLRLFAARVVASLRRDDFVARIGGDEFAVIINGYSHADALKLARRIVDNVASQKLSGPSGIRASLGLTAFLPGEDLAVVFERADTALYDAKRAGKGVVREALSDLSKLANSCR